MRNKIHQKIKLQFNDCTFQPTLASTGIMQFVRIAGPVVIFLIERYSWFRIHQSRAISWSEKDSWFECIFKTLGKCRHKQLHQVAFYWMKLNWTYNRILIFDYICVIGRTHRKNKYVPVLNTVLRLCNCKCWVQRLILILKDI